MGDQIDMFGPMKRGRGRPKGDRPALTGAERMRRLREQARTVLNAPEVERDGRTLASLSDTALCELVRGALRVGHPLAMTEIITELMNRTNARRMDGCPAVHLARWVEPSGDWYQITHGDVNQDGRSGDDSRTVTVNEGQGEAAEVPVVEPMTGDPGKKGTDYPLAVRVMAVEMLRAAGGLDPEKKVSLETSATIAQAIKERIGRAPDRTNLPRQVRKWAQKLDATHGKV